MPVPSSVLAKAACTTARALGCAGAAHVAWCRWVEIDQEHSYEYVPHMIGRSCGCTPPADTMAAPMTGSDPPARATSRRGRERVADDVSSSDLLPRDAAERLADTMFALATPSRLQILAALRHGPRTVSEIIALVGMEQSAVSHQLRVLRDHAVVSVERRGRERLYGLRDHHIGALLDHAQSHVLELEGRRAGAGKRARLDRAG